MAPSYGILDMTAYGRQETWKDSPSGWPQPYETLGQQFRKDGRPTAQWTRIAAGHDDNLHSGQLSTDGRSGPRKLRMRASSSNPNRSANPKTGND